MVFKEFFLYIAYLMFYSESVISSEIMYIKYLNIFKVLVKRFVIWYLNKFRIIFRFVMLKIKKFRKILVN